MAQLWNLKRHIRRFHEKYVYWDPSSSSSSPSSSDSQPTVSATDRVPTSSRERQATTSTRTDGDSDSAEPEASTSAPPDGDSDPTEPQASTSTPSDGDNKTGMDTSSTEPQADETSGARQEANRNFTITGTRHLHSRKFNCTCKELSVKFHTDLGLSDVRINEMFESLLAKLKRSTTDQHRVRIVISQDAIDTPVSTAFMLPSQLTAELVLKKILNVAELKKHLK